MRAHYGERGNVAVLNAVGGLFFHLGEDVADDFWGVVGRFWGARDLGLVSVVGWGMVEKRFEAGGM